MWTVRAIFSDRRSGVAAVATGAAHHNLVLMGLRSRPGWNGMLIDELVLATPGGWSAERLEEFMVIAGAATVQVSPLVDEPAAAKVPTEIAARRAHPAGTGSWLTHAQAS